MSAPRLLIGCAALLLASAGCAGGSDAAPTTTVPATTAAATITSPPTTVAPTSATIGFADSAQAAAALVEAWNADDRARAAEVADSVAVEGIFATPDPDMWLRGCSLGAEEFGDGGCIYRTETGAITINTERRDIGWVVATADWGSNDEVVTEGPGDLGPEVPSSDHSGVDPSGTDPSATDSAP